MLLLNEVQKQQTEIRRQQAEIERLRIEIQQRVAALERRLTETLATVQSAHVSVCGPFSC